MDAHRGRAHARGVQAQRRGREGRRGVLLLVQVIYVVIRWYVKGWRETRGYY